ETIHRSRSGRIELTRNIVEEQDGLSSGRGADALQLRHLQRESQDALLSLGCVTAGWSTTQLEGQLVSLGAEGRGASSQVLRPARLQLPVEDRRVRRATRLIASIQTKPGG